MLSPTSVRKRPTAAAQHRKPTSLGDPAAHLLPTPIASANNAARPRIEIAMTEMNVKPIAGERSWEFGKIIRR